LESVLVAAAVLLVESRIAIAVVICVLFSFNGGGGFV
jgi:hypothetical protein